LIIDIIFIHPAEKQRSTSYYHVIGGTFNSFKGDGVTMTNVDEDRKNRSVITDAEFNLLRAEARVNEFRFLALRNEAILCALRLFGKRRAEFGSSVLKSEISIPNTDPVEYTITKTYNPGMLRSSVWVDENYINFNFKVLKKHKSKLPEYLKRVSVEDPLAYPILRYINYLDGLEKEVTYFLPSAKNVFGNYIISYEKCLPSRCIYDVVRDAGNSAGVIVWPHLFRETAGSDEIKDDPSVFAIAKVMNRLNIHERTAWAYMERHVMSIVKSQQKEAS